MPKRKQPRKAVNLYKRGQSYYYSFYWKGKRYGPKSLGPVSEEVAHRLVAEVRLAVIEGRYHERPPLLFRDFCGEFIRWYRPNHAPLSTKRYAVVLERLSRQWEALDLADLTPVMIEDEKRRRSLTMKPDTVNMDLRVIRHLCATAVAWGRLAGDPAKGVKGVLGSERRRRILSVAEESRLLAECNAHLKPVVIFGLETGLRYSELVALRWRALDLEGKTVLVEHAKSRKTRVVPLTARAITTIRALPRRGPDDSVFGYVNFLDSFIAAARRAGIPEVRPHAMRHSYATRCLEAGVDLVVLQRWLGHSSLTQTQIYTHVMRRHEQASLEKLERHVSQQRESLKPGTPDMTGLDAAD